MLQAPSKPAAHQRDIDHYLLRLEFKRLGDRVTHVLRNLGRRPEFTLRAAKLRSAIARLHWRMGQKWCLKFSFDLLACTFGHISDRVERDAFVLRCGTEGLANLRRFDACVRSVVPRDL